MFDRLTDALSDAFNGLKGQGTFTEKNLEKPMIDIRKALLSADVAVEVVDALLSKIKIDALGQTIMPGVKPQMAFAQLVHDHLVDILGGQTQADAIINVNRSRPLKIMLAGTQGVGKTTTVIKLARWLKTEHRLKVMVASVDVYRPAAIDQLQQLANHADIICFPSDVNMQPQVIVEQALLACAHQACDALIIDTAGRLSIDESMMDEISTVQQTLKPQETLLVVESILGQQAAAIAKHFAQALAKDRFALTGVILTKTDSDAQPGAALSVKYVTNCPIKFMGKGEHIEDFDYFDPKRIAGQILGMGDVIALVRKAKAKIDEKQAQRAAKKMAKGLFDLDDYQQQIEQMMKMGGMRSMLSLMPGMSKMSSMLDQLPDDDLFAKHKVLIQSMTPKERQYPDLLKQKTRLKRIINGSGLTSNDLAQLLKLYQRIKKFMGQMRGAKMQKMMKQFGQMSGPNNPFGF